MGYECTSPLYRIPFASRNFPLLNSPDQCRLKNHGVFLKYDILQYYQNNVPGWSSEEVQKLRCGQCASCRLAYSFDWALRCSLEASLHEHNYFVTLTYDNFHLPSGEFIDYAGDLWDSNLCRRDVQLFIKNLREWERTENGNTGIKVFYCGEYGSSNFTSRPHYHLCLFGVSEIPDLTFGFKKGSFTYYKSKKYESFWSSSVDKIKVPRGFVDISEVSFDAIAYTARYCMKKQRGLIKKDFLEYYQTLDPEVAPELRTQPFIGMSLKPGIASQFYEDNKLQIYSEDLVKYQRKFKLFKSKPPRYFDKLFDREEPATFDKIKRKRFKLAIASQAEKNALYSESELSRLSREADLVQSKVDKYYVRDL